MAFNTNVLIGQFQQWFAGALDIMWGVLFALLIILVGYVVASIVSHLVVKLCEAVGLEKWVLQKTHMRKTVGSFRLNHFLGLITKWYILVPFLGEAANWVGLGELSGFLRALALYIPNVIAAALVGFFGFVAADYVQDTVLATKAKGARLIGDALKVIILIFTALIALDQIGLAVALIQNSFLVIMAGIMFALALAVGLSFGLGLKGEAAKTYKQLKKKF